MILEISLLEGWNCKSLRIPLQHYYSSSSHGFFIHESWKKLRENMRRMRCSFRVGKGGEEEEVLWWEFEENGLVFKFLRGCHDFLQLSSQSWSSISVYFHDHDQKNGNLSASPFILPIPCNRDRSSGLKISLNFKRP